MLSEFLLLDIDWSGMEKAACLNKTPELIVLFPILNRIVLSLLPLAIFVPL